MNSHETLLTVKDLVTRFDIRSGIFRQVSHRVHAVESASFEIGVGETLALVGESGSVQARFTAHISIKGIE